MQPLRERSADIPELARHFVERKAGRMRKTIESVSRASMKRLKSYSWPGNLDELQSVLECAIAASDSETLDVDPSLLEAGSRIGHYQLEEKIGEGGMGEVWRARHRLLVRPAAVKLIHPTRVSEASRDAAARRFEREARATATLESPNTVRLYDYGVSDEGAFYYVMEYLRGMDLSAMVDRFGALPPERVVYLLSQACGSLAEAHGAGMVHRDIKPANLFAAILGRDHDVLKVLDFGMVRNPVDQVDTQITGTGPLGTPHFIPPEVARAEDDIDGRADLYSLGCAAYYLLSGQNVFPLPTAVAVLTSHVSQPPPPLSSVATQPVPAALEALVMACLAKQPDARPASAEAVREALDAVPLAGRWTAGRAADWWRQNDSESLRLDPGTAPGA